jgi:hypothetical protein
MPAFRHTLIVEGVERAASSEFLSAFAISLGEALLNSAHRDNDL